MHLTVLPAMLGLMAMVSALPKGIQHKDCEYSGVKGAPYLSGVSLYFINRKYVVLIDISSRLVAPEDLTASGIVRYQSTGRM